MPGTAARPRAARPDLRTALGPGFDVRIGVHTGEVIVGNIGSDRRMKYAAVGSHVNLTGRIESYTTGGQLLISESTLQEVGTIVEVGRSQHHLVVVQTEQRNAANREQDRALIIRGTNVEHGAIALQSVFLAK